MGPHKSFGRSDVNNWKKAKHQKLKEERDKEYKIIDDAKNILSEAIGVEIDSSQHILLQLAEAVKKFNDDSNGQENLIEKAKKKFDGKVLEHIAQIGRAHV